MRRLTPIGVCALFVVLGHASAAFANGLPGSGAPEIDAGALGPGLTVLIGGLLLLCGTRVRRK
jgi:hypothetical protein